MAILAVQIHIADCTRIGMFTAADVIASTVLMSVAGIAPIIGCLGS